MIHPYLCNVKSNFYPRSPCGERRFCACSAGSVCLFLSTLSLRRATGAIGQLQCIPGNFYPRSPCGERHNRGVNLFRFEHFYPRSPCGERRWLRCWQLAARDISIHALLAESDSFCACSAGCAFLFLSTLSLRRATVHYDNYNLHCVISIHALLAESDWWLRCWQLAARDISIHALLAESDSFCACSAGCAFLFLSTLSLRRATVHYDNYNLHCVISIHALLAESDGIIDIVNNVINHFYPRSPCGERR